ncbi:MAG: hypothetical protein R3300_16530, partial [Candidatus Promineifilaceae bacterium]|nr:hypothetical protein [Candidatus Promineifilaceae bacterium]
MSAEAETAVRSAQAATAAPFADSRQQLLAALAYADLRVRWAVARARAHGLDPADEFRGLYITEGQVDALLENGLGYHVWSKPNGQQPELAEWPDTVAHARRQLAARNQASKDLLLGDLIDNFDLSAAEVDVLLLTLAPEIDPRYERLYSYLQDDVTKKRPSVDLMLNLLSDRFEEKLALRRYFTDEATLFRSRLLERGSDGGREATLLSQTLRPAARVVEHLLGIPGLDSQLSGVAELMLHDDTAECPQLPETLLRRLEEAVEAAPDERPMLAFRGPYGVGKRRAAEHVACRLNRPLITTNLAALAAQDADLSEALRLALRDGRLLHAVVYLVGWDAVLKDGRPPLGLFR